MIFLLIHSNSDVFLIGLIKISVKPILRYSSLYSYLLSLLSNITGILKFLILFNLLNNSDPLILVNSSSNSIKSYLFLVLILLMASFPFNEESITILLDLI